MWGGSGGVGRDGGGNRGKGHLDDSLKIAFISTFGDDVGDGMGGAWGYGIVSASAEKLGPEEATGEVCPHERRE